MTSIARKPTDEDIRDQVRRERAKILANGRNGHVFPEQVRAQPAFPIPQAHDPEGQVWGLLGERRARQRERLADVLPKLDHPDAYWAKTPRDLAAVLRRARADLTRTIRLLEDDPGTGVSIPPVEGSIARVRAIVEAAHEKHMAPILAEDEAEYERWQAEARAEVQSEEWFERRVARLVELRDRYGIWHTEGGES